MKGCKECGKKLRLFEGYRHPVFGRQALVCSNCYDSVNETMVKWREANLPYVSFFQNNSSKNNRINLKEILPDLTTKKVLVKS